MSAFNSTYSTNGGANCQSSSSGLEDVNYLLFLESVRRFKDDEMNLRRQVEEKTKIYQDIKNEYNELYAKYVGIIKLVAMRCILDEKNYIADAKTEVVKDGIGIIAERATSDSITSLLDVSSLEECKTKLKSFKSYKKLKTLESELVENKTVSRSIKTSLDVIEIAVESAVIQGMDYFVHLLSSEKN